MVGSRLRVMNEGAQALDPCPVANHMCGANAEIVKMFTKPLREVSVSVLSAPAPLH